MFRYIFIVSVFILTVLCSMSVKAQTALKTRLKLEYFKTSDKSKILVAKITVKKKKNMPLQGVTINFYNINDTTKVLFENIKTDNQGEATLVLSDKFDIYKDTAGLMSFEVKFEGNDTCKRAKKELSVKEADLGVSFFKKDTIKFIEILANEQSANQENVPIKGADVLFYVKGTFSLLKIGEKETDDYGKAKIEFPTDIPGDTAGVLTIVTKIEENDDYGTVIAAGEINWGKPIEAVSAKQRGLGDTDAPLWMVYTLIVLLSVVWFHYMYVIYQIIRIKLEEKNTQISQ